MKASRPGRRDALSLLQCWRQSHKVQHWHEFKFGKGNIAKVTPTAHPKFEVGHFIFRSEKGGPSLSRRFRKKIAYFVPCHNFGVQAVSKLRVEHDPPNTLGVLPRRSQIKVAWVIRQYATYDFLFLLFFLGGVEPSLAYCRCPWFQCLVEPGREASWGLASSMQKQAKWNSKRCCQLRYIYTTCSR